MATKPKRSAPARRPTEIWLYRSPGGNWNFSFDPPLKRNRHRCHRMVSEATVLDDNARMRAERNRLVRWLRDIARGTTDETARGYARQRLAALKPTRKGAKS